LAIPICAIAPKILNMKTVSLLIAILFTAFSFSNVNAQDKAKETVKVYGNCDMCKARIEKAAKTAGASTAKWDDESQILSVTYDTSKTNLKAIEEKVAGVGYDTEHVQAKDDAYGKLPSCCRYERKKSE
jgi:periplasmic mercuric ion binding protein